MLRTDSPSLFPTDTGQGSTPPGHRHRMTRPLRLASCRERFDNPSSGATGAVPRTKRDDHRRVAPPFTLGAWVSVRDCQTFIFGSLARTAIAVSRGIRRTT